MSDYWEEFKQSFTQPDSPQRNSVKILPVIAVVLFMLIALSIMTSVYTIETNEVGVVLRFGQFSRITESGLHLKIPFSVEKVFPVKIDYIYKEEFGFRTRAAGVRSSYTQKSYDEESLMLTGDLNVLDMEWIVQYRISNPVQALFNIRDLQKTIRDLSESVMRKSVGDYSFNEALTTQRIEINVAVQEQLQEILDTYNAGIQIVTVKLQDVNPPNSVKPAFNEVNEAKQEREKLINQAWEVYNQKIPQARGEALKMVKEAEGYALEKVNNAQGESARFTLLYDAYSQAKDVTLKRLYLEQMSEILSKSGKKYVTDSDEKSILPLLRLE